MTGGRDPRWRHWWLELVILAALGVLLMLLGPFGSFALPAPLRLLDWELFLFGGALFFRPVIGAARLLAIHGAIPLPLGLACACILAAFPTTPLVAWGLSGLDWRRVEAVTLVRLYPQVLLIGGLATLVQVAIQSRRVDRPGTATVEPDGPAPPPLRAASPDPTPPLARTPPARPASLSRLPAALGGELLCLQNEDHYVRAHTSLGSTLILMRLGDAVAELDGIDGIRTHRSWWVARHAVREVVRRDRAVALRLRNGLEVPVARTAVPLLREAGWLAGQIAVS